MPIIIRKAKDTFTPVELDKGDVLEFTLMSGDTVKIELVSTHAEIIRTTVKELKVEEDAGRTDIRFTCDLKINGKGYTLEREISCKESFYDPWEIEGVQIWFDAVDDIFKFIAEAHGDCRPKKDARFGIQDATLRICPDTVHPWCPLPEGRLRIEDCYRGEDCWMGAYNGASAHGGLDINHPPGTPLWAPFNLDDNFYFGRTEWGDNNNRWRAIRRWDNGSDWIIQAHHMTELTIEEHTSIKQGEQFAWGAGVLSGAADHSHFVFKVYEQGEVILLDPWILFWQMYEDLERKPEWKKLLLH
jgi:hypothetical protein